jgi:hypothetical protein
MINKNIKYLNKDFSSLRNKLITFAKDYYPQTYTDFSQNSPGMMFVEMAAYVGDILSLYQDSQILEIFPQYARLKKNLLLHSYNSFYFPKVTTVATTNIDIFQLVPASSSNGDIIPDYNYCLNIEENTQVQSSENSQINFIIPDKIDFSISSSQDPTEISVYSLNNSNEPDFYLLKKTKKSFSGTYKTKEIEIDELVRFRTINLSDEKIVKIVDITDSDNNKWYEVPYLTKETILEKTRNFNNGLSSYLLNLKRIPRRFVTRFKEDNSLDIQFGSGVSLDADEEVIPNYENIGLGLPYNIDKLSIAYDPSNFLYTKTYGLSPSDTTLNITYLVGGGVESNVSSNTLNTFSSGSYSFVGETDNSIGNIIINSLTFNNENAAVGGGDGDSIESLKQNSLAAYPTQLRAVTDEDYLIRSLSLPSEYGLVAKSYITKNTYDSNLLSLYILSKDNNNNLINGDDSLKNNLKIYLDDYRTHTDSIDIKDAFIINIGLDFDITLRPNYNNKMVIKKCLDSLKQYFNIDRWNINQPIILSEIYTLLDKVEGVQTVKKVKITNKYGENQNYSKYGYDINAANVDGVIYPSLDPSIFEIKFPDIDIQGRTVNL